MPKYPYAADIEYSRLRMDPRNPRLPIEPDSQRDGFGEMAAQQGQKLVALCKHVAENGLNPAHRFIVIPDDEKNFIVLDANRRLTALRGLEQPDLLKDRLSEADMKQLRKLAAAFSPPEDVPCIVFEKRDDADPWIELQHQGESDGVGLVEWTAQQKARFRSRRGGARLVHLQVLDFVRTQGEPSAEATSLIDRGRYPVSTLERVLMTPYVREKLGVDIVDGRVITRFPKSEVLKGLTRLVNDIGSRNIKVGDVMSIGDRKKYINRFKPAELPSPDAEMEDAAPLDAAPDKAHGTATKSHDRKRSTERTKVIPTEFSVTIQPTRINDIYLELKRRLKVDDVPNAVGALLRVFLELSVDHYVDRLKVPVRFKEHTLANKVTAAVDYMVSTQAMTEKQAAPVREAVKSGDKVSLATNLNALIHSPDMTVSGNDLKALWGRLEFFVRKLWSDEQPT